MTPRDHLWKASLIFSLLLHVVVLLLAVLGPIFFHRRPIMPEVYTVNLFTAIESSPLPAAKPAAAKKPAEPKPPPPPETPPPEPVKTEPVTPEAVQIEPEIEPIIPKPIVPEPVKEPPKKAISLKPDNVKKKLQEEKERKAREELIKARAQAKVKARKEVEKAKRAADQAAKNAVERLRESLLSKAEMNKATTASPEGTADDLQQDRAGGSAAEIDSALKRYYAEVALRVNGNWSLPDVQNLPATIEAILVVKVNKDGVVVDSFFELKSDNPIFDSAVMRTLQKSVPLPPFPPELRENNLDIGLRFTPGGLQ